MLGKMIKYEFKATAGRILPVMLIMVALAIINRITVPYFVNSNNRLINSLHMLFDGLLTVSYIALAVVAFLLLINRFYKNVLGDEGYTTMTLPVNISTIIWSKLITSLIWMVAIILIYVIASVLRVGNLEFFTKLFADLSNSDMLDSRALLQLPIFAIEGFIICAIVFLDGCVQVYTSLTYGHMFKKHKVFMAAVIFAVIMVVLFIVGFRLILFLDSASANLTGMFAGLDDIATAHMLAIITMVIMAVPGAIMYLATVMGLKKNLNLE